MPIRSRHVGGVVVALLVGLGLALAPLGALPVTAADPLQVSADATYTLDPGAGRVHVLISYQVRDLKPNSDRFVYFYTGYRFGIQREARSIRASDAGGALSFETQERANYLELTVDFRRELHYRETAKFSVRYDLVGGAPRSASVIRVGNAFATWGVWAWGDPGRGTVVVRLPTGFRSSISGDSMTTETVAGRETLSAAPASPETFFAIVSAENEAAYTADRLSLDGGVEIVVMAWPQDTEWDDLVKATLGKAMPELRDLIGLDWPVNHDLDVRERYTPALEGYAGVFFTGEQRIDVSENLDTVTIVHEASHAWLNEDLFADRWIYEGLAQEYAWRTLREVGGDRGGLPDRPSKSDPGAVQLEDWSFPRVIRDQRTDDSERYGYEASFWVIHHLVEAVGAEGMRKVFASAQEHTTAYPGAGKLEPLIETSDWRHFLDLLENADPADAADFERTLRDFVLPVGSAGQLEVRAAAHKAYQDLVATGNGWLPGWFIRKPMGLWMFDQARKDIAEAATFLELRAKVDAAAAAVGVQPDGALKTAYESAANGLDEATALANDQLVTLTALADAKARVEAEPDLVSKVGLIGAVPQEPYDAARAAFERGDMAGARASAAAAAAIVTGAVALGQQRLAIGIGIAVVLLLLIVAAIVLRRRGARRRAAVAASISGAATTTLAADPDAVPPSTSEPTSEAEGGVTYGGPPADSESPSESPSNP
jgi:hypothetical protein